jgi:hypothetical protein
MVEVISIIDEDGIHIVVVGMSLLIPKSFFPSFFQNQEFINPTIVVGACGSKNFVSHFY